MQSLIQNDHLYVSIDGNSKKYFMPKVLLQVSAQEILNSMVSNPEESGLKDARDEDINIINSDSTFHNIIPPQLKNMTS